MRVYDLKDIDNWQMPQQPPQAVQVPAQPAKKKSRAGLWVIIILLLAALIAEPFAFAALQSGNTGISDALINEDGELVIRYADGSEDNLGVVVGEDGSDGQDGLNGSDGKDGFTDSSGDSGNGGNVTYAANVGLRSAVSIYCTFTQEGRRGQTSQYYSAGSGVIYQMNRAAGDALIITNYHVVFDADSRTENGIAELIQLYLYGSEIADMEIEATYVGGSQYYDLAVLKVENSEVLKNSVACAVTVGDSDSVRVGSTAIAVGNPEGEGISASSGVISVDSEYITMTAADGMTTVDFRVMRIDTAVNSGNSGGGLFDDQGRLIGIVNAKIIDDTVENIGYALPSTTVIAVVENIIDYCLNTDCETVRRAIMGVTVITSGSSAVYDEATGAVLIQETVEIYEVSPGQIGAVFKTGDVLVSATLDGVTKQLTRQHHVIDLMLHARPGDTVEFVVLRNGRETKLEITVTEDCLTAY